MEDFIAVIFVVIAVIGALSKSTQRKKKVMAKSAARRFPEAPVIRSTTEEEAEEDFPAFEEGMSRTDADGCVGGSIESHEEEGESLAEHTAHLPAIPAAPQPRSRRIGASDLRRAVVMSEILNRPVSLRR